MRARLKKAAMSLLAVMVLMALALPAASQEPDRPEDHDPPSPTQDATGDQDTTAGDPVAPASATFDDFVRITNPSGSGDAEIRLDGSAGDGSTQWDVENDATAGNQLQFLFGFGTAQMVLTPGGLLGLGTVTPQDDLHIANTGNDHILLEDTDGASFNLEAGGDFFDIDSTDFPLNNFRIHRAAPSNALVVGNGIGVGTASPEVSLDIRNIAGENTTQYRITNGDGTQTWSNGVTPNGTFQFNKVASGGAEFIVREREHAFGTLDVQGPVRATAFNTTSDKNVKTDFAAVNPLDVLASLKDLPVSSWRFKGCKDGEGRLGLDDQIPASCTGSGTGPRHVGPTAQDFQHVFGLGDGESIATVDADGVIMASLQGLTQLVEEKDARITELEEQVSDLESLKSRVDALEAQLNRGLPRVAPPRS